MAHVHDLCIETMISPLTLVGRPLASNTAPLRGIFDVHPTPGRAPGLRGGTRRVFRQVSGLEAGSGKVALSRPTPSGYPAREEHPRGRFADAHRWHARSKVPRAWAPALSGLPALQAMERRIKNELPAQIVWTES